jgi:hypothetical protein
MKEGGEGRAIGIAGRGLAQPGGEEIDQFFTFSK